jgi:hypothetical protein
MSTITIQGLDRVIKEMDRAPKHIAKGLVDMMNTVGTAIEREMKLEVPNDRGNLRRSIAKKLSVQDSTLRMEVGPSAPYALDLHTGTNRLAGARDYGQRGVSRVRTVWLNRFKKRGDMEAFFKAGSKSGKFSIAPNKFVDRTAIVVQKEIDNISSKKIDEIINTI